MTLCGHTPRNTQVHLLYSVVSVNRNYIYSDKLKRVLLKLGLKADIREYNRVFSNSFLKTMPHLSNKSRKDSITYSMDSNLSKLQKIVKNRRAWLPNT